MPSKQKDKPPSIEELKAATTTLIGTLEYLSGIVDFRDLTEEQKREVYRIQDKAAELLEIMRQQIIAQQKLLQIQREQIERTLYKRLGVRKPRKRSNAGQPKDHKG